MHVHRFQLTRSLPLVDAGTYVSLGYVKPPFCRGNTASFVRCNFESASCAAMCPAEGEALDCDYTEERAGFELLCPW